MRPITLRTRPPAERLAAAGAGARGRPGSRRRTRGAARGGWAGSAARRPASAAWRSSALRSSPASAASLSGGSGSAPARPSAQGVGELPRGRVAERRVALERPQHGGRERLGHLGVVGARRQRALVLAPDRQLGKRGALPRQAAGQELVDDDAERVDVGGGRRLLAARLLRREVGRGARRRSPTWVSRVCSAARAIPKSVSLTVISPVGGSWGLGEAPRGQPGRR